jgi:hypothetical protein
MDEPTPENPDAGSGNVANCNSLSSGSPCPYDNAPTLAFKVNFHFVQNLQGGLNFSEWSDGAGGNLTAEQRAQQIIDEANKQTEQNDGVWGTNPWPAMCKLNFKVLLNGVYFHRTNVGLNAAGTAYNPSTLFNYFNNNSLFINSGSEINILIFESSFASGIAYGNHATLHNAWSDYIKYEKTQGGDWYISLLGRVLWHEIFHNNGLPAHPFQFDACDDTPTLNPPCWAWSSNPNNPCHTNASNNLMDYNEYANWSLSPCQICQVNQNYNPNYVTPIPPNCPLASASFKLKVVYQPSQTDWYKILMDGTLSKNEDRYFIEVVEVASLTSDVAVGPYLQKWFMGQIGNVDLESALSFQFQCSRVYRIKLAVMSPCSPWHETVKKFEVQCPEPPNDPPIDQISMTISPNPANAQIQLNLDLESVEQLSIHLVHSMTNTVIENVISNTTLQAGNHSMFADLQNFPEGLYYVRLQAEDSVTYRPFLIQRN